MFSNFLIFKQTEKYLSFKSPPSSALVLNVRVIFEEAWKNVYALIFCIVRD